MQISNPEDVISQLPDDILCSIISLIPTKEALSTRILSKRWTNLFRFVPTITFCAIGSECTCTCNSEVFLNGVYKVLRRHSACIRSFVLRCCIPDSCTHTLEQSIFALGDLGVKELTLRASCSFNFPSSFLFSFHLLSLMSSLQYLKLSRCSLQPSPIIYLSNSLKTLRLCKVIASSGSLESILSSCLSLCTLTLKQCELPFKLCFPRLNLQINCIVIHECKGIKEIDFYASNLTTVDFHSKSRDLVNLIFDYVPRLQIVYITAHRQYMSYYCGRLAKYLPSLKTLVLDNVGNLYEDGCIATGIDMFKNLKRLELVVFTADYLDLFSLSRALQEFPRLEEFHLSISSSVSKWPKEENQVMVHSQSQLKVVEISGFGGQESQVQFALYILKSAALLEQMIISWYACLYDGFGRWGEPKYPPCYRTWHEVYDCIQQMKHEAVSETLQVVAQKLPRITLKQF